MSGAINPVRRHHIERIKKQVARRIRAMWRTNTDAADDDAFLGRMVTTRVSCSGPCCGNPRRWYGQGTRQERLADIETREALRQ